MSRQRPNGAGRAAESQSGVDLLDAVALDFHHHVAGHRNEVNYARLGVDAREHGDIRAGDSLVRTRVATENGHVVGGRGWLVGFRSRRLGCGSFGLRRLERLGEVVLLGGVHAAGKGQVKGMQIQRRRAAEKKRRHDNADRHRQRDLLPRPLNGDVAFGGVAQILRPLHRFRQLPRCQLLFHRVSLRALRLIDTLTNNYSAQGKTRAQQAEINSSGPGNLRRGRPRSPLTASETPRSGGPTEIGPYDGLAGPLQIHARKVSGAFYSSTRSNISRGAPQMGHM